jgi:membrane protein DedA with SNARE-associated domain
MSLILIYISIFFGVILEGEMVLLTSAIAAERGLLVLWVVVVIAFSGTLISDWTYFFLGRYLGINWISKKPFFQRKAEIVHQKISKNLMLVLLSYRFLYGLRIITPFVLGTTSVKKKTFLFFSALTTLIWCIFYSLLGYYMGEVVRIWLGDIQRIQLILIGMVLLSGIIIYMIPRSRTLIKKVKKLL